MPRLTLPNNYQQNVIQLVAALPSIARRRLSRAAQGVPLGRWRGLDRGGAAECQRRHGLRHAGGWPDCARRRAAGAAALGSNVRPARPPSSTSRVGRISARWRQKNGRQSCSSASAGLRSPGGPPGQHAAGIDVLAVDADRRQHPVEERAAGAGEGGCRRGPRPRRARRRPGSAARPGRPRRRPCWSRCGATRSLRSLQALRASCRDRRLHRPVPGRATKAWF